MKKLTLCSLLSFTCLFANYDANFTKENLNINEVPLEEITLYSSGLGYFKHKLAVKKDDALLFHFSKSNLNEVLNTLMIDSQDFYLTYQAGNYVSTKLKELGVNPLAFSSVADFLRAYIGSEIKVELSDVKIGKILNVENYSADNDAILSLLSQDEVLLLPLKDVKSLVFTDKKKNEALKLALTLLASSKEENSIKAKFNKDEDVSIAYLLEVPAWKMSYRLQVENDDKAQFLALVNLENSTKHAWDSNKITLYLGNPNIVKENLYNAPAPAPLSRGRANFMKAEAHVADASFALGSSQSYSKEENERFYLKIDNNVTIKSDESALLPLINSSIPIQTFYTFDNIPNNVESFAQKSLELENSSNIDYIEGSVAIFNDAAFLGTAKLKNLVKGDKELLSFSEEKDIKAKKSTKFDNKILIKAIINGSLTLDKILVKTSTYSLENLSDKEKVILIKQAILPNYQLQDNEFYKDKDLNDYSFQVTLAPKEKKSLEIVENHEEESSLLLASLKDNELEIYAKNLNNDKVQKEFSKLFDLKKELAQVEDEIKKARSQVQDLDSEQTRLRANLNSLEKTSSYYKEFLNKLLTSENSIDEAKQKIKKLQAQKSRLEGDYSKALQAITLN